MPRWILLTITMITKTTTIKQTTENKTMRTLKTIVIVYLTVSVMKWMGAFDYAI
jgi:hypothetical protein